MGMLWYFPFVANDTPGNSAALAVRLLGREKHTKLGFQ